MPMSRQFYSDAKKAKMCHFSSSSPSHFLFPRDFSGTVADTDVINTQLEPLRPADVPFGGYKTETKDLGGETFYWRDQGRRPTCPGWRPHSAVGRRCDMTPSVCVTARNSRFCRTVASLRSTARRRPSSAAAGADQP